MKFSLLLIARIDALTPCASYCLVTSTLLDLLLLPAWYLRFGNVSGILGKAA